MSAASHFDQAREVALLRLAAGDVASALGGLLVDLQRHPGTAWMVISGPVMRLVRAAGRDATALRDAIEHLSVGDHHLVLPSWDCDRCGVSTAGGYVPEPWPCEPARRRLLAYYHGSMASLRVMMTTFCRDALRGGLAHLSGRELGARFLDWVPEPDATEGRYDAAELPPPTRHRAEDLRVIEWPSRPMGVDLGDGDL